MTQLPVLRRSVIKASVAIACLTWPSLAFAAWLRAPDEESVMVVAVGWPIVYTVALFMIWVGAQMAGSADESVLYGPQKARQLQFLRGPGFWWINACVIIFPAGVLVLAILVILGVITPENTM